MLQNRQFLGRLAGLLVILIALSSLLCLGVLAEGGCTVTFRSYTKKISAGDDVPVSYELETTCLTANQSKELRLNDSGASAGLIALSGSEVTLTGVSLLETVNVGNVTTGLYIDGDATLTLSGDSDIRHGIYCTGNLTIKGDDLDCTSASSDSGTWVYNYYDITVLGHLTVSGSSIDLGDLTVGGNLTVTDSGYISCKYADADVGGSIRLADGGLCAEALDVDGDLTITGGTCQIGRLAENSTQVFRPGGNVSISGDQLESGLILESSEQANARSTRIGMELKSGKTFTVSGGMVTAKFISGDGNLVLSGGSVTAATVEADVTARGGSLSTDRVTGSFTVLNSFSLSRYSVEGYTTFTEKPSCQGTTYTYSCGTDMSLRQLYGSGWCFCSSGSAVPAVTFQPGGAIDLSGGIAAVTLPNLGGDCLSYYVTGVTTYHIYVGDKTGPTDGLAYAAGCGFYPAASLFGEDDEEVTLYFEKAT